MRYHTHGFIPINEPPARRQMLAATVEIIKGDVLCDNGSGYATNADTALAATHMGVAAADLDNNPAVSGAKVEYYPFDTKTQYMVPVSTDAVLTQANVGDVCTLGNNDDLDIATHPVTGIGFRIDSIDISAAAIAANTYGYAIGHFVVVGVQAN